MAKATLTALFRALVQSLVETLAPSACVACDALLAKRAVFCPSCAGSIEPAPPPRPDLLAFGAYGGPLAQALRRLKYQDRPDLGRPLGELLRITARNAGMTADLVLPVPLHPRRLVDRGYNQAALLAAPVAFELDATLSTFSLRRLRHTPPQARLDRAARGENLKGAFDVRRPSLVAGRRVVLVDDVSTTGATLQACRAALLEAGAKSVTALVVAHTEA